MIFPDNSLKFESINSFFKLKNYEVILLNENISSTILKTLLINQLKGKN